MLEDVLLIKEGEMCLHMSIADLKEYAIGLNGQEDAVNEVVGNREILYEKRIGSDSAYIIVKNNFTDSEKRRC